MGKPKLRRSSKARIWRRRPHTKARRARLTKGMIRSLEYQEKILQRYVSGGNNEQAEGEKNDWN